MTCIFFYLTTLMNPLLILSVSQCNLSLILASVTLAVVRSHYCLPKDTYIVFSEVSTSIFLYNFHCVCYVLYVFDIFCLLVFP